MASAMSFGEDAEDDEVVELERPAEAREQHDAPAGRANRSPFLSARRHGAETG